MTKSEIKISSIDRKEALPFIKELHYARRVPSISFTYGYFLDEELVGVLTIGKPASHSLCVGVCGKKYSSHVYELNRICFKRHITNGVSKLISYAMKDLKHLNLIIVSYSDTSMDHVGYVYQASNFLYTGKTKERTDKYVPKGKHSRHYDSDLKSNIRIVRSAKHRYVYITADKRFKKEAMFDLKYKVEDYPKIKGKRPLYTLGQNTPREIIVDGIRKKED